MFPKEYLWKPMYDTSASALVPVFEKMLGETLPSEYRQFLLRMNGVTFKASLVINTIESDDEDFLEYEYRLIALFGLVENPHAARPWPLDADERKKLRIQSDLRFSGQGAEFSERVPKHIIAIGCASYHSNVCISLAGSDRGTIYLWSPEMLFEEQGNVQTYDDLYLLDKTFNGFLDSLRLPP